MNFLTAYTYNRERSQLFATKNTDPSLTQQSDKDETDINVIVARYKVTGQLPQVQAQALYQDFTEVTDYRDALHRVQELEDTFMQIPAEIRSRFENDPQKFVEFATNPDNIEELRKLGLANPAPEPDNSYESSRRAYDDNTGVDDEPSEQRTTTDQRDRDQRSAQGTGGPPRGGAAPLRDRQDLRTPEPGRRP